MLSILHKIEIALDEKSFLSSFLTIRFSYYLTGAGGGGDSTLGSVVDVALGGNSS